ncbi:AAA family ATPase [Marinobacter sp. NFXS11]|uniref:ATP-binding protein n=1 Tax=Marinobacter sp. NFXS11 TaxID=2818432 RepID=UPI0032DEEC23
MKIRINKEYKSISSSLSFELPLFTVLTGENGSGKTHLFEAISNSKLSDVIVDDSKITNIVYIPFGDLSPKVDESCDPAQIAQRIKLIARDVENAKEQLARRPNTVVEPGSKEQDPIMRYIGNADHKEVVLSICEKFDIFPSELNEDIIADGISSVRLSKGDFFNAQFALIFKNYHVRYLDNKLNKVYLDDGVEGGGQYLSEEEFREKFGAPPWDFVNSVLDRLDLPYTVNNPMLTKRDSTFYFKLVHKISGIEVSTNDLSTGEKTLMSLALAIYNSTGSGDRAQALIVDEPDAPLHPSMSKLMLEILEEEIVMKHQIPVLISTHSPTTIACAPPTSLYKVSAENKVPARCSLEESMGFLAYGIPNLRVSVERRRQVFVEHQNDVEYFELFFEIVSRKVKFDVLPEFLPPHTHTGSNCSDVISIVKNLRDKGNDRVYGLIDFDMKNRPESQIIILGNETRYAIENFVFDPFFLGVYLIHKNFAQPSDVGLDSCFSYVDVVKLISKSHDDAQKIVDAVESNLSSRVTLSGKVSVELLSGKSLSIDSFFIKSNGHDLEKTVKDVWPVLNSVRSNNGGDKTLKKEIISTVIKDFPDFVSQDMVNTFRAIE